VGTTLAAVVGPLWSFSIIALALASINVSLTGFCVVGNVLYRLGFTPMLGRSEPDPRNLYFMQTDRWYLERRIYLAVGINLSVASVLAMVHSPWWLLFPAFVGVAMLVFATTGFCIMANSLYWFGAEPRLNPEHNQTCVRAHVAGTTKPKPSSSQINRRINHAVSHKFAKTVVDFSVRVRGVRWLWLRPPAASQHGR
jgi:hypothetical protein